MINNDQFIKLGFWSQLILLVLVDWGSLASFAKETPPWYHYVGFAVVNIVLILSTAWMWKWLHPQRTEDPRAGSA